MKRWTGTTEEERKKETGVILHCTSFAQGLPPQQFRFTRPALRTFSSFLPHLLVLGILGRKASEAPVQPPAAVRCRPWLALHVFGIKARASLPASPVLRDHLGPINKKPRQDEPICPSIPLPSFLMDDRSPLIFLLDVPERQKPPTQATSL